MMYQVGGLIGQFGDTLGQLSTTEGRLAASAAVVVAAMLLALVAAPMLVRQLRRMVAKRYLGGGFADFVEGINDRFPLTTPMRFTLGLLQFVVAAATVVALLQIWGYYAQIVPAVADLPVTGTDVVRALVTVLLLLGAYLGMGLVEDIIESFSQETNRMTAHQEQIVVRVLQIMLLVFVGLLALGLWNANPRGLLAGAGFLGIVLGLAARQTLGALIAGFVLMFSRPFEIGDWVVVGEEEGIVTDITIVNTRLENFDGEFVVIPNDRVADRAITNRSQKGRLRLRVDVGIDYENDPQRAVEIAEETIAEVDLVESTPSPYVFPREFGDSSVVLELRFWIEHPSPPKRWRAQAAVVRDVKRAFDEAGIKIPYPQRELSDRDAAADAGTTLGARRSAETDEATDRPTEDGTD